MPGPVTSWSDEETAVRDSAFAFAKDVIGPRVKEMDHVAKLDPDVLRKLFEVGFMGIETPADLGGSELSFVSACIVVEQLARVDPAVSVIVDIHNTLINTAVRKWGTSDQKRDWLPRLATDALASFCLSEASSGSDAFALKTTATTSGSDFLLNGSKMWISNAAEASLFLIFANTMPDKGYRGITAFMVDRESPGLQVGKKEDKLGIRASSCCEVLLDNVRVPKDNLLGEIGTGYKIAIESLNEGRIGIGAQMVGLAQGALDSTIPYLFERKQFGQPVGEFQGMRFQLAQARCELEAARLLVYNAARLNDAKLPFVKEAAFAKLFSSQVAEKIASRCVEWAGGVGYTKEFPMEKFYRDVKIGSIYEGTSNIHLQTIAKFLEEEYRNNMGIGDGVSDRRH
eukprot:CAMPEP_0184688372 /NCGR_PEP_ID=MMETSP0312-20130426/29657_1 /TAXON_ID=31354 /ORGANISM="Compsopogon coeruleus, Strain SAG 36.94" /LENGTH=398 /DNA_ID=CAMNT_0027145461 /DNA_START=121 /DNA_END=1318 /DNA_ORIENTATION=+